MTIINNINISGPINIVRLEGKIDGINKILYLFFDVHLKETKCKEYDSLDIVQLFNKFIDESKNYNNEWDLFIENDINVKESKKVLDKSYFRGTYINEITNFFENKFTESVNNLVKRENNIRYHFFDIRFQINFDIIYNDINNLIYYNYEKNVLIDRLNNIYNLMLNDYNYLKGKNNINKNFKNLNVKNIILNLLKVYVEDVKKLLIEFNNIKEDLKKKKYFLIKELNEQGFYEFNNKIQNILNDFSKRYLEIYFKITDLYFLRRFLDKNYIKNGIIYSGNYHCLHIILNLVKLFKFRVSHVSYSSVNLQQTNSVISKSNNFKDLIKILLPKYLIQCSSMKNFPDMFL